ncbi:MAG TPA: Rieske 2Fe-2S domain-containing protein [Terriglobales bacterium]|nr:Rieske 2Fe-2S domain-containing protein [Terriglobales bacterium]
MKIAKLFQRRSPPPLSEAPAQPQRRSFLHHVGLGALLAGLGGQAYSLMRALVPNVLYEPPMRIKPGSPQQFPDGVTFLDEHRVFIVREKDTLHAISATCTHLGCTVKAITLDQPRRVTIKGKPVEIHAEFHCPCHGSKYYGDGTNYAGPAPKPLPWLAMEIAPEDGQLVVDASRTVEHDFRLKV